MKALSLTLALAAVLVALPGMATAAETTPCDPGPAVWVAWCQPPTFGIAAAHVCLEDFSFNCAYL